MIAIVVHAHLESEAAPIFVEGSRPSSMRPACPTKSSSSMTARATTRLACC